MRKAFYVILLVVFPCSVLFSFQEKTSLYVGSKNLRMRKRPQLQNETMTPHFGRVKGHPPMRQLLALVLFIGVVAQGCGSNLPAVEYHAVRDTATSLYFVNGIPIATASSERSFVMFSVEPYSLTGSMFYRLWFLYRNDRDIEFLFDPSVMLSLKIPSFPTLKAEPATNISSRIDNERAAALILEAIGGGLQELAARPTQVTSSSGQTLTIHDKDLKQRAIRAETNEAMRHTATVFDIFKESVTTGILRKNTIFPGQSANGYVYFPLRQEYAQFIRRDPMRYKVTLIVRCEDELRVIDLMPMPLGQ